MRVEMKRSEESGIFSKKYILEVKAHPTPQELAQIRRHKLGAQVLFENYSISGGYGLLGLISRIWISTRPTNVRIRVNSILEGARAQFTDVIDIANAETEIEENLAKLAGLIGHTAERESGTRSFEV